MKRGCLAVLLVVGGLVACGDDKLSVAELQDPNTCSSCHPKHHEQWSGSMHAYASIDPVFRAMHARGQRETDGELGLFCVSCHAPMAVVNQTITAANVRDFDLDTLAPAEVGVTCYFCHNVDKVTEDHNNGLVIAGDQTMRGGLKNAVDSPAHHSAYDTLMDSERNESEMCGSCHDIVNPAGVHVERTFAEWKQTIFATSADPAVHLTCGNCHMEPSSDVVADAPGLDVPLRNLGFHDHSMPAIDQALTPFPQRVEQAAGIQAILEPSIGIVGPLPRVGVRAPGGICLDPPGTLTVRVDSFNVGHSFPSGAAFDRRVWLEVIAYDAANQIVFQSGVVPDGMDPEDLAEPTLFGLWDRAKKADGSTAHFAWEVASIDPDPRNLLPGPVTFDKNDPRIDHSRTATFTNIANFTTIDRIEARLRMRALPYALLADLVASGDLAPQIVSQLPTLEVQQSTWLKATAGNPPADNTNCNPR